MNSTNFPMETYIDPTIEELRALIVNKMLLNNMTKSYRHYKEILKLQHEGKIIAKCCAKIDAEPCHIFYMHATFNGNPLYSFYVVLTHEHKSLSNLHDLLTSPHNNIKGGLITDQEIEDQINLLK